MKHPANTDIAVLLLFFTRSDTFAQVFEAVRQARPSKLFLYQDGPRGEKDMAGIMACREIDISTGSARYTASIWIIMRGATRRDSVPISGRFHWPTR